MKLRHPSHVHRVSAPRPPCRGIWETAASAGEAPQELPPQPGTGDNHVTKSATLSSVAHTSLVDPAAAPASAEQGGHRQARADSSAFDAAAASLAVSSSSHALRRWRTLTQRIKEGDCKPVHVDGA